MLDTCACYLGFDYGHKRIGIAVGQGITRTAQALKTVHNKNQVIDWQVIEAFIKEWQPAALVVGLPLRSDGSDSASTRRT